MIRRSLFSASGVTCKFVGLGLSPRLGDAMQAGYLVATSFLYKFDRCLLCIA